MNIKMLVYILGKVLLIEGVLMLLPVVCGAIYGEKEFLVYLILAAVLTNLMNSPGACYCIVFPLALQMCKEYNVSPSKVMSGSVTYVDEYVTSIDEMRQLLEEDTVVNALAQSGAAIRQRQSAPSAI